MKYALFLGCTTPVRLKAYESSSRAVLGELGVTLVDIDDFKCCGYPLRNIDFKAFVLSSARNLALAKKEGLKVMALCKCGYGTLKKASYLMKENTSLREEINAILAEEGLQYDTEIDIMHLLTVLYKEVGLETIKEKITRPYENLKVATHYGCHALRPSQVTQFDDPVAPTLFDELVNITGAKSIEWSTKLECCGGPLLGVNDELSFVFRDKKLSDAKKAGADYLTTGCPYCQIQFDTVQNHHIPSILYSQLLGLCLGLDKETLGFDTSRTDIAKIENFLAP